MGSLASDFRLTGLTGTTGSHPRPGRLSCWARLSRDLYQLLVAGPGLWWAVIKRAKNPRSAALAQWGPTSVSEGGPSSGAGAHQRRRAIPTRVMGPPQLPQVSTSILKVRLRSDAQDSLLLVAFFRLPWPLACRSGVELGVLSGWGKSGKTLRCGDRDASTP